MEALGVAASAVQLAAYSASIITFIGKLFIRARNLPQQYHQYEVQLLLLIHITFNIENNPALQTKDIKFHLEATTKEVAALQSLLCRPRIELTKYSVVRRLRDTLGGFEQQVSSRLERLHQITSVLQISLESENTRQVYCIKEGVKRLNTVLAMSGVGDQKDAQAMQNSDTDSQLVSATSSMPDSAILLVESVESMQASSTPKTELSDVLHVAPNSRTPMSSRTVKHKYGGTTMGQKCTLIQGNIHNGKGPGAAVLYHLNGSLYGRTKLGTDSKVIRGDIGYPESVCGTGHEYEGIESEDSCRLHEGDVYVSSGQDFLDKFMGWDGDKRNVGSKVKVEVGTDGCKDAGS